MLRSTLELLLGVAGAPVAPGTRVLCDLVRPGDVLPCAHSEGKREGTCRWVLDLPGAFSCPIILLVQ